MKCGHGSVMCVMISVCARPCGYEVWTWFCNVCDDFSVCCVFPWH